MAMTECNECNQPISTAAAHCPKCGCPTEDLEPQFDMSDYSGLNFNINQFTGASFLHGSRHLRLMLSLGFAGFGLIAMTEIEIVEFLVGVLGIGLIAYFFVTLMRHLFAISTSSKSVLKTRINEVAELAAHSLLLAFACGFWFGFGETFGSYEVTQTYIMLATSFSSIFVITCLASIPLGLSILVNQELNDEELSEEPPSMGNL